MNKLRFWKLITITFMLTAIGSLGYLGWAERQPIFAQITGPKLNTAPRIPIPSDLTRREWIDYANSKDYIVGVSIVKVDFRENTRATTFRHFKIAELTNTWNDYTARVPTSPLFSQNEAANQRLINLINGNFSCVTLSDTAVGQAIPQLKDHITDVCIVPIPPGYGDFIGFVNVFLNRTPNIQEITNIKAATEELALTLYERDVTKTRRRFGGLAG